MQPLSNGRFYPNRPDYYNSAPEIAYETLAAVSQSVAPSRDMVALTAQLRGIIGPRVAQTEPTPYQLRQHVADLGSTAVAYFSASDEVVTAVNPYSNQREMLIISLDDAALGSDAYYATIAHEWQHAIQWHTDPNETA